MPPVGYQDRKLESLAPIKVIVSDYIEQNLDWEASQLSGQDFEFQPLQLKHAPREELKQQLADAEVLIVNMAPMDADILNSLSACKLLIRHGAGADNIDVAHATKLGIRVCYVPDYCQDEVAEQALLLTLTTHRAFPRQVESLAVSVRKGVWDFQSVPEFGRLAGLSAGIIGCGRIGSRVMRMYRSLDLDVHVCDPYLSVERQRDLQVRCEPLTKVLMENTIISIHCALTNETRGMIDTDAIQNMRPDAILINTARGAIVDSHALAEACRNRKIRGAGIDVYVEEPPAPDFPLLDLDNVILTPHMSWYSSDAEWSIRKKIIEDVFRYKVGEEPRFPLN